MTINELIEKLKEYGDEKSRDMGIVRIVDREGRILEDNIDVFDVKFRAGGIDIPFDNLQVSPYQDDDSDDYWEDDEEYYDEEDEEDESFEP